MMSAKPANLLFEALLDPSREVVAFEPLMPLESALRFEVMTGGAQGETVEMPGVSSEPYQRKQAMAADPAQHLQAKLFQKDQEIAELQQRLAAGETELETMRAGHQAMLEQAEAEARAEFAQKLTDGLAELEDRLRDVVTGAIADILAPFLSAEFHKRILQEFSAALRACLATEGDAKVRIEGPATYLEGLRRLFRADENRVVFAEADTLEIMAEINGKLIVSRFDHWSKLLTGTGEK